MKPITWPCSPSMSGRPSTYTHSHRGGLVYRRQQRRSRRSRGEHIECCPLWGWLLGSRVHRRRSSRRQRDSLSRRLEELGRHPRSPSESERSRSMQQGYRRENRRREHSYDSRPSPAVPMERSSAKTRPESSARRGQQHFEGRNDQQNRENGMFKDFNLHLVRRQKRGQSERVEEHIRVSIRGG